MCDRKNEGGRCFPHKEGTQALIDMTENLTDLPKDHIKQTAKELKQEGKSLPTPSEEEVVALAMTNKFTARYDPRIPENKREKYIRKWQKAEKEKPNGGEFHSWKHTMVESVKRYKRTAVAALLGTSILVTSACGMLPNNDKNNNPAPTPEVTISAPASPTASPAPTASSKPSTEIPAALQRQGIETTGKTLSNSKGEYAEIALTDKNKLMKWDESKNDASQGIAAGWTKKDVEEAQQFASKFMVNKMIDSPANGDPTYGEQWVKENQELIHPDYRAELVQSAKSKGSDSFVFKESWQQNAKGENYGYVYDEKTSRIKSLDLNVDSTENISDKGMFFDYSGSYIMNAKTDSGTVDQFTQVQNIGISVIKEKDGFYIAGVFTTTNTADAS